MVDISSPIVQVGRVSGKEDGRLRQQVRPTPSSVSTLTRWVKFDVPNNPEGTNGILILFRDMTVLLRGALPFPLVRPSIDKI